VRPEAEVLQAARKMPCCCRSANRNEPGWICWPTARRNGRLRPDFLAALAGIDLAHQKRVAWSRSEVATARRDVGHLDRCAIAPIGVSAFGCVASDTIDPYLDGDHRKDGAIAATSPNERSTADALSSKRRSFDIVKGSFDWVNVGVSLLSLLRLLCRLGIWRFVHNWGQHVQRNRADRRGVAAGRHG
jgi:hypothetical protein